MDIHTTPKPGEPVALNLLGDLTSLFRTIVDIESVSGNEGPLADAIEDALRAFPHLHLRRDGDTIIARTETGRPSRVIVAGHLDTVPVADNLPSRLVDGVLYGRGTADMKGGIAVMLACAPLLSTPVRDITWIFYDHEEVAAALNSLGRLGPADMAADFAILTEPTSAGIEGGCQGTLRFEITTHGLAAHSARPWLGRNAIHDARDVLARLDGLTPREVDVDGLRYRESMSAVLIEGGVATNVIPDRCVVTVNFRFAPDRDVEGAKQYCREVFSDQDVTFVDAAPAAHPGLNDPVAQEFVAAVAGVPRAKYGWTDVARFAQHGTPAVNFGPGDPAKAHADDECCPVAELVVCRDALLAYFGGSSAVEN